MADLDLEYLSPSFDPGLLTVPRLRSILVAHNVSYPASAKKPQLIDLFNENVVPQARKILNARARTKRSTRGISDVPSSQETSVDVSDDDVVPPRTVSESVQRFSRRTTRANTEETADELFPPSVPSTVRPGRRTTSKHARNDEADDTPEPHTQPITSTKRRKSSVQTEIETPQMDRGQDGESPFSSDNPFQSGSSPLAEPSKISGERKRRTVGAVERRDLRRDTSGRRKTDIVPSAKRADGNFKPISRTFDFSASHVQETSDGLNAGEEFTPEETMALARQEADSGKAVLPARRRRHAPPSSSVARTAPWAVLLAMLGGLATVWRQEKLEVGYCGVGRPSTSLAGVQIPDWASVLQPQCEPCPSHAHCYQHLKMACDPDFVLQPHPLSLGGLIPLPPTCEPDGEKARRVKAVADRAVEELRERNAKFECGELKHDAGRKAVPEMDAQELKEDVSEKRRKGMSQEEFEDLWHAALGEITSRDEIVDGVDRTTGHRTLRSNSLTHISLSCAARRSFRLALARHLWQLIAVVLLIASGGYARYSITSGRETEARAKQLAKHVLDRLTSQSVLNAQDPSRIPEAWISMSQLRDDVLRDEFSASRRQKLWEKVQKKVEGNSNVRPMVREGRSGEVGRVWEWVGALPAIEAAPAAFDGRRESARYSLGPAVGGSSSVVGSSPVTNSQIDLPERRKWDEGRPIF